MHLAGYLPRIDCRVHSSPKDLLLCPTHEATVQANTLGIVQDGGQPWSVPFGDDSTAVGHGFGADSTGG